MYFHIIYIFIKTSQRLLQSHFGPSRNYCPTTKRYIEFCKIAGEAFLIILRCFMPIWKAERFIIYTSYNHTKKDQHGYYKNIMLHRTPSVCVCYNLGILSCVPASLLFSFPLTYNLQNHQFHLYYVKNLSKGRGRAKFWRAGFLSRWGSKNFGRYKCRDACTFCSQCFLHKSVWLSVQWALPLPGFCLFNWLLLLFCKLLKYLQPKKSLCNSGYWWMSEKIFWKNSLLEMTD